MATEAKMYLSTSLGSVECSFNRKRTQSLKKLAAHHSHYRAGEDLSALLLVVIGD